MNKIVQENHVFSNYYYEHYFAPSYEDLHLEDYDAGMPLWNSMYMSEDADQNRIITFMGKKLVTIPPDRKSCFVHLHRYRGTLGWAHSNSIRMSKILDVNFYSRTVQKADGQKGFTFTLFGRKNNMPGHIDKKSSSVTIKDRAEIRLVDNRIGIFNADLTPDNRVKDYPKYRAFNKGLKDLFAVLQTQVRMNAQPALYNTDTGHSRYGHAYNKISPENPFNAYLERDFRAHSIKNSGLLDRVIEWIATRRETLLPEIWVGVCFYTRGVVSEKPMYRLQKMYKAIQQFYLREECITIVPRNNLLGNVNNGNQQSELL